MKVYIFFSPCDFIFSFSQDIGKIIFFNFKKISISCVLFVSFCLGNSLFWDKLYLFIVWTIFISIVFYLLK